MLMLQVTLGEPLTEAPVRWLSATRHRKSKVHCSSQQTFTAARAPSLFPFPFGMCFLSVFDFEEVPQVANQEESLMPAPPWALLLVEGRRLPTLSSRVVPTGTCCFTPSLVLAQ